MVVRCVPNPNGHHPSTNFDEALTDEQYTAPGGVRKLGITYTKR